MLDSLKIGDRVRVTPQPGRMVQVDGVYGRFLPAEGADVVWSDWYYRRAIDGSIIVSAIQEPAPKKR